MTLTTACIKFFAYATQSESEVVCETKLYNYRTEQAANERTFASFSADVFHLYI
jgi:hypothetical protein